jgi:hypothetical protein
MKLKLLNGNDKFYITDSDLKLCLQHEFLNDVYLEHIKKETGLDFKKGILGYYWVTPKNSMQVVKFLTDASCRAFLGYTNNRDWKNILFIEHIKRD